MLILGVDPGLRATGYGMVRGDSKGIILEESGLIKTVDASPLPERLHLIYQELHRLVERGRPAFVAVEDLYAARRFPRTAILMGHVRGVVCLAAAEMGLAVVALPPSAVKQAITGFGAASKAQIQIAVRRLLHMPIELDPHVADAVAMALTALSREGVPLRSVPSGLVPSRFASESELRPAGSQGADAERNGPVAAVPVRGKAAR